MRKNKPKEQEEWKCIYCQFPCLYILLIKNKAQDMRDSFSSIFSKTNTS